MHLQLPLTWSHMTAIGTYNKYLVLVGRWDALNQNLEVVKSWSGQCYFGLNMVINDQCGDNKYLQNVLYFIKYFHNAYYVI